MKKISPWSCWFNLQIERFLNLFYTNSLIKFEIFVILLSFSVHPVLKCCPGMPHVYHSTPAFPLLWTTLTFPSGPHILSAFGLYCQVPQWGSTLKVNWGLNDENNFMLALFFSQEFLDFDKGHLKVKCINLRKEW